jgi:hypothetical protein
MADLPEDEREERVERARLVREEARETIEEQIAILDDLDEKAIQMFRVNIVVASILVSGISIAVSTETTTMTMLLTPYTQAGAVFLFISTILAATTYTSTSERIGISSRDVRETIMNQRYDYDLIEEEIALEYANWIRYNYERNTANALLFTLTLISAVGALIYVVIGVIDVFTHGVITPYINLVVLIFFVLFGWVSGVYGQIRRWVNETAPDERFIVWLRAWKTVFTKTSDEEPEDEKAEKSNDRSDFDKDTST